MPTSNYVMVDGKFYSPKHPLVLAHLAAQGLAAAPSATQSDFKPSDHVHIPHKSPKRLKQSQRPLLNGLELEFYGILRCEYAVVLPQSLRFKLGNGIWYKPDFVGISPMAGLDACWTWRAFEVKGPHAFRGGFENLKVAAHQYPFIKWMLTWKDGGKWVEQLILP